MSTRPIVTTVAFNAETITKNTTEYSSAIDLNQRDAVGSFSVQVAVTGDGVLTLNFQVSNDGATFRTPTGSSAIFTSFTKTSGPSADGKAIYTFSPPIARFLKLAATETGTAADAVLTATLAIQ